MSVYRIHRFIFICFMCFIILISNKEILKSDNSLNDKIVTENSVKNFDKTRIIKDVLFINGCQNIVQYSYRYRVIHQMEQLNAGFLESDEIFYLDFEPDIVCNFRVKIFFRCPWTENVDKAIKLAKELNKRVLFDIDDLVKKKYTKQIPYLKTLASKEKESYDEGVKRIGKTLRLCDDAITNRDILTEELKDYVPYVFINRDIASEEMGKLNLNALQNDNLRRNDTNIIIGYFSGSITHNSDLEMIEPAIIKILKEYNNVQLLIFGQPTILEELNNFNQQIIKKNFTDWRKLPQLILNVDINIAPIEDSIFNQAKS